MEDGNDLARRGAGRGLSLKNPKAGYFVIALVFVAIIVIYLVTTHYKPHEPKVPLPRKTMTQPEQQPTY